MKKLLVLVVAAIFVVSGCSSEHAPTVQDGTTLVVVKHKTASGTAKRQHKKKSASAIGSRSIRQLIHCDCFKTESSL